jgi:hypothetical protein
VGKMTIKRKVVGFQIAYPSLSLIMKYALKAKLNQEDDQEEEDMNYAKDGF